MRPLEVIFDFNLQKITEGSGFRGYIIKQKMFLNPGLGGTDEVSSGLRGHLRPFRGRIQKWPKNAKFFSKIQQNSVNLILSDGFWIRGYLRSLEAVFDLKLKKLKEGSNFWGYIIKQKMFLDPKLGGTDEVRSDLRGRLRPFRGQLQ